MSDPITSGNANTSDSLTAVLRAGMLAGVLCMPLAGIGPAFADAKSAKPDAAAETRSHCFSARQVSDWRYVDKNTVDVRAGVRNWFRLTLIGNARELDFDLSIALRTRGSNWICTGDRFAGDIVPVDPFGRRHGAIPRWHYTISGVELAPDHPKFIKAEEDAAEDPSAVPAVKQP